MASIDATERDWDDLRAIGKLRARSLVALSLNLSPSTGVRKRLASDPGRTEEYKARLKQVRYALAPKAVPGGLRFIEQSENDPVGRGTSTVPTLRVVMLCDFVAFALSQGWDPIAPRLTEIAQEIAARPAGGSTLVATEQDPADRNAKTSLKKQAKSMARVLLGILRQQYNLEIDFTGKNERPFGISLKARGGYEGIRKAVEDFGFDAIDKDTPKSVIKFAIDLLGEGEVRRAFEKSSLK